MNLACYGALEIDGVIIIIIIWLLLTLHKRWLTIVRNMCGIFRPPRTIVLESLMCYYRCLFFYFFIYLFCHKISELLWSIAVKLCHMIDIWLSFIMQVQKFGAVLQKLCANNMQNLGQFYTISDFDSGYLHKETRYPRTTENDSSRQKSLVNFGSLNRK